jgi:Chlorophyll A-B binding protein
MQTGTDNPMTETKVKASAVAAKANGATPNSTLEPAYNGIDRNAWIFGFNPQQELWNGRLAMIGIIAYFIWDFKGYSVLRDVLHFIR